MALNSFVCADMPLRNYSLTHDWLEICIDYKVSNIKSRDRPLITCKEVVDKGSRTLHFNEEYNSLYQVEKINNG